MADKVAKILIYSGEHIFISSLLLVDVNNYVNR